MNQWIIAALCMYAAYTGQHPFTLIQDNLGKENPRLLCICDGEEWLTRVPPIVFGDLNADGITDQADIDLYNELMPPVGFQVGTGKIHLFTDCRYIAGKQYKIVDAVSNICLTCLARKQ